MKKQALPILILIGVIIVTFIGLIHIIKKQTTDAIYNPPSCDYVEEDMEIWLLTTKLHCEKYVLVEDDFDGAYCIYFIQRLGEERYYFVVYKLNKKTLRYKYNHYVEVNKEEYLDQLENDNF